MLQVSLIIFVAQLITGQATALITDHVGHRCAQRQPTNTATGSISGSHLNASDKISIQTGDLNLLASKNTYERQSEQEHGHMTAQMTVYGASGGASITGSFDRSKDSERSTTHNNSTLTANNIDLFTSGDANIRGANVHANDHLEADIQGDLNLESVQDRSNSRNTSVGVSGGVSFGGTGAKKDSTQGLRDVGGMSGVNGGISSGNGMSVTRETVLTSLTSGGTANVNVNGHTQITGALLATVDAEGNDLNQLNFNTGSLNFTDLRNISQSSQTNAGVSANFGVGDSKADTNPREGQTTAEGANGNTLYANTSNLTYSNSQENSASKTLATLGHGNITVGSVQQEKDGELTEAGKANGSPLIGMNRDTTTTEKELWNSEQSQTVDATLDHRLLTEDGRNQIKEDYKRTEIGIEAIGNLAENSVSFTGKGEGETSLRQHMMASQDYFSATKDFVQGGNNAEHVKALSNPNATPEQKQAAYTALVNTIAKQMGIDPTQAKVLLDSDPAFAGAYSRDTKMVYVNDLAHDNAGAAVNTVGHETQHYLDDQKNPTAERTAHYESNRDEYAGIMGNATEDYLSFNFAQSGNSLAGSNSYSLGTTASQINKNVSLLTENKKSLIDENAGALDNRRVSGNHAMALPAYLQAELERGNDKGVSAQDVMVVLFRLAENHGRMTNLNAEIDQLDPAALGVSPETLEAVKNLPDAVKNRIVAIELKDLCEGTACKIAASIVDGMVNPESFDQFALEYAGGAAVGKVIDVGVDAYLAGKAGSKAVDGSKGVPSTKDQLEVGQVETYQDSKRITGDGSIHRDHQPSKAALIRRAEEIKGEPLTPAEIKRIENNATIVTVPDDVHRAGPTYGGKNTRMQQETDAKDLQAAATRDANAMVDNAKDLAPNKVPVLQEACKGITCTTNSQYDDFLRNQLDK
jgi:hypothetical protein